jgi:hypothetical protein
MPVFVLLMYIFSDSAGFSCPSTGMGSTVPGMGDMSLSRLAGVL